MRGDYARAAQGSSRAVSIDSKRWIIMAKRNGLLDFLDLRPLAKTSRLRYGPLETRGVPSILFCVAAIVLAVGASRTLVRGATALPETLRETRLLLTTVRPLRPELRDDFSNGAER